MKIINTSFISGDTFIALSTLTLFFIMLFCISEANKNIEQLRLSEQYDNVVIES